jgi:hypothetical protein
MKIFRRAFLLVVAAVTLQGCVIPDVERRGERDRYDDRFVACGRDHRLYIMDLDMSPDPIGQGERVRAWRVRLRADGSGECQTTLRIRERRDGDIVGLARLYRLRPGNNDIEFDPVERYRFTRAEHCFEVIADIAGTGRAVDAARTFCARERPGHRWSLR